MAFAFGERIIFGVRVAEVAPVTFQPVFVELVLFRFFRHFHLWQGGAFHVDLQGAVPVDHGPCVLVPAHGGKECLASHDMLQVAVGAVAQANHPPGAVRRIDEVGVAHALDGAVLHLVGEVGQYRVGGARRVGAVKESAARDGDVVSVLGAAFGKHQVVESVLFVNVRPFGIAPAHARPQPFDFGELFAGLHVDFADFDVFVFPKEIAFPVVEEEGGGAAANGEVYENRF